MWALDTVQLFIRVLRGDAKFLVGPNMLFTEHFLDEAVERGQSQFSGASQLTEPIQVRSNLAPISHAAHRTIHRLETKSPGQTAVYLLLPEGGTWGLGLLLSPSSSSSSCVSSGERPMRWQGSCHQVCLPRFWSCCRCRSPPLCIASGIWGGHERIGTGCGCDNWHL